MDILLTKIFATALVFSQVTIDPGRVKVQFDPTQDRQAVSELLRAGCAHTRKAFDVEEFSLDDLIAFAMEDIDAFAGGRVEIKGLNIKDLHVAYREFCSNEAPATSPIDLRDVIEFYNRTLANLPDHTRLKGMKLPGTSSVFDLKGNAISAIQEQYNRRIWVPLSEIPRHVQQAFIAAEDKRFYEHGGIDERALIRAFIANLVQSGRPQGGSTITQQVVKNVLVGEDVTYERKMREMILASRVETTLTKSEILELYLNAIYLGRASWGIEMAARSYFGKSARTLTVGEGALLAALTKGPNYFNPDRNPDRAKSRVAYVADRLYEDSVISAEEKARLLATGPKLVSYEGTRHSSHFVDHVAREAKAIAGLDSLTIGSDTVRSTLHSILQEATESALQEGLASYEINSGRVELREVEGNLGEDIRQIELKRKAPGATPAWQQALGRARFPLYDVHWPLAVIVEKPSRRGSELRVGLSDGRVVPLVVGKSSIQRQLKLHDVVFVRLTEKGKFTQAELRVRPVVQGSAVVLENKTGRILALAGGFSYPLSQLNRVTQATRQPGSSIKPLTYLAALQNGLQPNTLVRDRQITLPPIRSEAGARSWTPKNYGGDESGVITLRQALEKSKNLATVNLLEGGVDANPAQSLDRLCTIALEAQIYKQCMQYYPFVLGAQPVRPIDLATFYATIANEGIRPTPYVIESIEQKGRVVYRHTPSSVEVGYADRVSFYQLKTMLQGVLQNGTARSVAHLAPYVAGKTGTTDGENDAWFAGFTNDVTVVIWVGYDNADGARRTLGEGRTGGNVALPIFEPIIEAVWAHHVPKAELNPPSPQAKNNMVVAHGGRQARDEKGTGLVEYLRRDGTGRAVNSEYKLVSRREDSRASKVVVVRKRQPAFAPDSGQVWTQTYTHTQTQPQSQTQNWSWSGGWDRRSSYRQPSFFDNNRW